jgi:hypothetical protein
VYGLMSTLDHIVGAYNFLVHLLLFENTLHTALFLCIATFSIMWYEWALPFAMIAAGLKVLQINYTNKRYEMPPPNVANNIVFIKTVSEFVITLKFITDQFLVDIVYWQSPKNSVKLLAFLFLGAPIALIGVFIVSIRLMLVLCLWIAVFSNIDFF